VVSVFLRLCCKSLFFLFVAQASPILSLSSIRGTPATAG
jgi:hypothetical protein